VHIDSCSPIGQYIKLGGDCKQKLATAPNKLSDYCSTPNEQSFSYFMVREQDTVGEMMMMSALYKTNTLSSIFIVLAH
jgi:hypothetical protein